jgi:Lrp/AsnC family leucine-responsive transcriptional regulator
MASLQQQISKQIVPDGFEPDSGPLDAIGWRILCELQENARLSFSELGRRVGMTPPAVAERMRRLEDAGVIRGYSVDLDVERLGLPLQAFIRLARRGSTSAEVAQAIAQLPEVLECHNVTGEDCYVLKVALASIHHLEGLLERLSRFGNTTTSIVISTPVTRRVIGPRGD